jgi:hypothetical protein
MSQCIHKYNKNIIKNKIYFLKELKEAGPRWFMPIILATQEEDSLGWKPAPGKHFEILYQKYPTHKGLAECLKW